MAITLISPLRPSGGDGRRRWHRRMQASLDLPSPALRSTSSSPNPPSVDTWRSSTKPSPTNDLRDVQHQPQVGGRGRTSTSKSCPTPKSSRWMASGGIFTATVRHKPALH